jgi:TPR repeat protein
MNDHIEKESAETTEAANAASTLGGDSGGIPSESAELAELARRATDGCGASAFELALRSQQGTGGISEYDRWLKRSCDLSHAPALVYAGRLKLQTARIPLQDILNIDGISPELESTRAHLLSSAAENFARAAEQGNAEAEVLLAKAYLDGSGVEENATKSAELNRSAAEKGNAVAQARVSRGHLHGNNGFEKDFVKYEHWLRKATANEVDEDKLGDALTALGLKDALAHLKMLRISKSKTLDAIAQASGLVVSSEAKVAFVLGPLPEHMGARDVIHHMALCFLHGVCGLEKSVRLAKDMLKMSLMNRAEYDTDDDIAAQKALLKQIRRCSGCGKYAYWTCKLCRGVRYCSRRCQKWHWKHGDGEPHKTHCLRVVTTIPEGTTVLVRT